MKALELKIPPPIYALAVAFIMWLLNRHFPVAHFIEAPWNKVGIGVILVAALFDVWSILLFFKKRTTPNPMKPENASGLVTEGLYKVSRNPMYVVMIIMLVGYATWLGSITPFLVIPLCYWLITEMQIKPEERALIKKFGEDYQAYKNSVRRWL